MSESSADQTFRILAADKLAPEGLEFIRSQADAEVDSKVGLSEDELCDIVGEYDGMIVRSGVKVTERMLQRAGKLRVVARAGVGVDNIDLNAATKQGIVVLNTAEANTVSTAEHAFALLIALARNIGPASRKMYEGGWDRSDFVGEQLSGKTLGIVGFGRIGHTIAERALVFGMDVVAYDPFINAETAMEGKVKLFSDFEEMLPHADALTFHVPLNDQTRGMLNARTFEKCRDGVMVVNASRGGVVAEEDLIGAIDGGKCGGAALDVYTEEPPPADSPLRKHPKVLLTPHLGASTRQAQQAVSIDAATNLLAYLRGEGLKSAVNVRGLQLNLDAAQNRFVDLVQRMSELLSVICTGGVKRVKFEIQGKKAIAAADTIERYGLIGLLQSHLETRLNLINVKQMADDRGIEIETVIKEEGGTRGGEIALHVEGGGKERYIVGHILQDQRPRIAEIDGYHMDMIPEGTMVILRNEDKPGMVGLIGQEFGEADVNIADMAISRHEGTALTVLKIDGDPPQALINRMRSRPGVLFCECVQLPPDQNDPNLKA